MPPTTLLKQLLADVGDTEQGKRAFQSEERELIRVCDLCLAEAVQEYKPLLQADLKAEKADTGADDVRQHDLAQRAAMKKREAARAKKLEAQDKTVDDMVAQEAAMQKKQATSAILRDVLKRPLPWTTPSKSFKNVFWFDTMLTAVSALNLSGTTTT